jgi:hypothetical protein
MTRAPFHIGVVTSLLRHHPRLFIAVTFGLLMALGTAIVTHRPFPPDATPEGAYARIALALSNGKPKDAFAYLETDAQWACYSIRDARHQASGRVKASYPEPERARLLEEWRGVADAPDGSDVFVLLATRRGWIARLEKDLSGATRTEIRDDRATVVTARNSRYSFRRRDNGIWGLTLFTAELQAEAERAARDLEVITRAADDYERGRGR